MMDSAIILWGTLPGATGDRVVIARAPPTRFTSPPGCHTHMRLAIDKVDPGMVLVEDVVLPSGGILLNSPVELTASHIAILKRRGIRWIQVERGARGNDAGRAVSGLAIDDAEQARETPATKEPAPEPQAPPTPPRISVSVSPDRLSADLRVEPAGGANEVLKEEDIIAALSAEGVVFGISQRKIDELVEKWTKIKRLYDVENIAAGEPPSPGREGQLEFLVPCLSTKAQLEAVKAATYCFELDRGDIPIHRVDRGTTVAQRQVGMPPVPGKNVLGEVIPCDEIIKIEIKAADTIDITEDGEVFAANITGLPYFVEGTLGVVPVSFDGAAEIQVSHDRMKAELIIHPAIERGNPPSEEAIRDLLTENSVYFGIKDDVLNETLQRLRKGIYPDEPVVVAEGEKPEDGENGKVEFLFNTESSLKPKANPDGSVDYKNVDLVHAVSAGAPLAKLIPAGAGTPGRDVNGNELACKDGTNAQLPRGPNTVFSDDDDEVLVAGIDGNAVYN
ncbi:MAG: DUF342 domain-containing protein, partial [Chitinivibrionales bacterium]|nr:DUF342 domain-containing protein [Chitinivibrionales bacterium]MBD3396347.1 DUF342 domain-containing protein [Chitinivibrionales bacterium]